ncbi:MAG: type I-D CRISPR-associated protein Cas7/Csc2 [Actinobacteria bacterium]|nr:type I-D CRISPR-associated protein Cas7/Csc2 [Actinomycetota bacterium]
MRFYSDVSNLPRARYLQVVTALRLLDPAIIRSNEPEEVLTFRYREPLGERFIIPWRKVKAKLRRLVAERGRDLGFGKNCFLKESLCLACPTCLLFGGTGETGTAKVDYNLLSRVLGETFISKGETIDPLNYTANAVGEMKHTTGQALMTLVTVPADTEFIGVITLKDPTPEMAALLVDGLERFTRIGARSVEWGRCRMEILGGGIFDREVYSAYELLREDGLDEVSKLKLELPPVKEAFMRLQKETDALVKEIKEASND